MKRQQISRCISQTVTPEREAVSIGTANTDAIDLPTRIERTGHALTAPELAGLLGMGRSAVYELAATGVVPHFRIRSMIRFDPAKVAQWLRERESGRVRKAA